MWGWVLLDQGSNWLPLHCKVNSQPLDYQGSVQSQVSKDGWLKAPLLMLAHKKELEVVRTEICLKQPKLELATYFISFILFFGRAAQLVGSQFPYQGLNLRPQQ